jgi:DNA repair exonuclease SbcCD nuclease subunit
VVQGWVEEKPVSRARFLHTADWQLGMRRHFLGTEALPRFRQARIDVIGAIARLAREQSCEFVGVCGDIFESNQIDRSTLGRTFEALAAIPCPVFLLPGNHDPLDAGSLYRAANLPDNARLLSTSDPIEVRPGLEVVGVPWRSKRPHRDLVAQALATLAPGGPLRVCLAHGIVDRLAPDRADPALIHCDDVERALEEGRIHFLALGDRHSTTQVGPRIWYSGAPEPTDYNEVEPGQVLVVELDESSCNVERHRTGRWRFLREIFALGSQEDVAAFAERLDSLPDKDRTILKLALTGTLSLRAKARLDAVLEEAVALFAALELWERKSDLVVAPDDLDVSGLGLAGFAQTTVERLATMAQSSGEARDALALLYRLARS